MALAPGLDPEAGQDANARFALPTLRLLPAAKTPHLLREKPWFPGRALAASSGGRYPAIGAHENGPRRDVSRPMRFMPDRLS